jgi:hypothetical protein
MAQAVNPHNGNRNCQIIHDSNSDAHFAIDLTDGYAWGDVFKSEADLDKIFKQLTGADRPEGYLEYSPTADVDVHPTKIINEGERIGLPTSVDVGSIKNGKATPNGYIGSTSQAGSQDSDAAALAFREQAEAASLNARARAEGKLAASDEGAAAREEQAQEAGK